MPFTIDVGRRSYMFCVSVYGLLLPFRGAALLADPHGPPGRTLLDGVVEITTDDGDTALEPVGVRQVSFGDSTGKLEI